MISKKLLLLVPLLLTLQACQKKAAPPEAQLDGCATDVSAIVSGSTGTARVFKPDPMGGANDLKLSPTSSNLDQFAVPATLEDLSGHGVLHGSYVHVGGGQCDGGYAAYSTQNKFSYAHGDPLFSEAMTYHYGSSYRKSLDKTGYLNPTSSIWMVTRCTEDNAFYYRDPYTGQQFVCLGVSSLIPSASFTDDATVSVHELQHATTVNTYSSVFDLNQFSYDEAGGLNEAISDFMSLTFTEPMLPSSFDPKIFSRWALGTFYGSSSARGAHRCPTYDPSYPNCSTFGSFSSATNTISYKYPDGMGWPYADNFSGPAKLRSVYESYRGVEEIHNIGILIEGALWDVYEAIKANHSGDAETARRMTTQLVLEALKQSPKPSTTHVSPVTFRSYSAALVTSAGLLGWNAADEAALRTQLTERGLIGGPLLDSTWARRDPAQSADDYMQITDSPAKLKSWIASLGGKTTLVKQTTATGLNNRLDPGETVLVWFNLQNISPFTAGGVELEVEPLDPEISLLTDENDVNYNIGVISKRVTQIQYGKINGSDIVTALSQGSGAVPTGNTYFLTNPYYYRSPQTGIWITVSPTAAHGKVVTFRVKATPSNGATSTVDFPATIQ